MEEIRTYLLMTCVMLFWGFNVSAIKILVEHFPPITITSLRIFASGAIVFLILALMKKIRKPSFKEWQFIFFGSLFNIVAHHFFLSLGLLENSATNTGLILGLGPILTALLSSLILKKIPTFLQILGFLSGSAGVSFIILSGEGKLTGLAAGDIYIFIAIFSQALSFIIISKGAKTMEPILLTGYMLLVGSGLLFLISLIREPRGLESILDVPGYVMVTFILSAVFATALGQVIYNSTIHKIGPAETSIFLNLNTFFSLVGSALILGEVIHLHHFMGLIFIVLGVLFGSGALEEIIRRRKLQAGQGHGL